MLDESYVQMEQAFIILNLKYGSTTFYTKRFNPGPSYDF